MRKSFYETLIIVLIAAAVFFGLRFTIQTYIVSGPSMEPNYRNSEWIIVEKLAYKFANVRRGDIIVFQPPISSTKPFIKRIIGLPGETVEIKDGAVDIQKADGSIITLQEPYIKEPFSSTYTSIVIPPNEYFVMGDNRNHSIDSRYGWLVSGDKIIGKAWISIWPPKLWGLAPIYRQTSKVTGNAENWLDTYRQV
jgi:signal peptidase I